MSPYSAIHVLSYWKINILLGKARTCFKKGAPEEELICIKLMKEDLHGRSMSTTKNSTLNHGKSTHWFATFRK